jgi:hypothetical protein
MFLRRQRQLLNVMNSQNSIQTNVHYHGFKRSYSEQDDPSLQTALQCSETSPFHHVLALYEYVSVTSSLLYLFRKDKSR